MKVNFFDSWMQIYLDLLQDTSEKGKSIRSIIMGLVSQTHSLSQVNAAFKETSNYRGKVDWYNKFKEEIDDALTKTTRTRNQMYFKNVSDDKEKQIRSLIESSKPSKLSE